jgi:hypothetical protein
MRAGRQGGKAHLFEEVDLELDITSRGDGGREQVGGREPGEAAANDRDFDRARHARSRTRALSICVNICARLHVMGPESEPGSAVGVDGLGGMSYVAALCGGRFRELQGTRRSQVFAGFMKTKDDVGFEDVGWHGLVGGSVAPVSQAEKACPRTTVGSE